MTNPQTITIQTTVHSPLETVWNAWTNPQDITQWNAASDDWCCPSATNDLRVGGTFSARMEAKDKSFGFDFGGTYTEVIPQSRIAYTLGDERKVVVTFEPSTDGVIVTETFDPEQQNPAEMQRAGWQAILDRFKTYTESKSA